MARAVEQVQANHRPPVDVLVRTIEWLMSLPVPALDDQNDAAELQEGQTA